MNMNMQNIKTIGLLVGLLSSASFMSAMLEEKKKAAESVQVETKVQSSKAKLKEALTGALAGSITQSPLLSLIAEYGNSSWIYPAAGWWKPRDLLFYTGSITALEQLSRTRIAIGDRYNKLSIYDIESSQFLATLVHDEAITCLVKLSDTRLLSASSRDEKLNLWDIADHACVRWVKQLEGTAIRNNHICVRFSDEEIIFAQGGHIYIKNVITGEESSAKGHDGLIMKVLKISPTLFATSGGDGIKLWEIVSVQKVPVRLAAVVFEIAGNTRALCCVSENTIVSGTWDGYIKIWDITDPSKPLLKSEILHETKGDILSILELEQNLIGVYAGNKINVLDISDSVDPQWVNVIPNNFTHLTQAPERHLQSATFDCLVFAIHTSLF